nr:sensor histidine kinase [Paeniclostridium ghonii]
MKKYDYIFICIPILVNITSIVVIFFIFGRKSLYSNNIDALIIINTLTILCISAISLIFIFIRIIKNYKLSLENKVIKDKLDMQYRYYFIIQENFLKTRKLHHDMKNHMICIQKIYETNELASKYIEEINDQLKDCISVFNTNNLILDVILNEKTIICKKNNIEFISDINFSKCNFIDMSDICSIFSNILDNAIESCIKIKDKDIDKKINLKGSIVNKFFVIKCENTKINNIIIYENTIKTDKEDKFLHGIGISSIKESVEKYNGNMEIDSTESIFTITIYIPLIKNNTQLDL